LTPRPRRWWAASGGYSLALLALGSLPGALLASAPRVWDKAAHAVVYGALGGLVYWAARVSGVGAARAVAGAVLWAALVGALDEWHQQGVRGRTASVGDLVADVLGALGGAGAAAALGLGGPRRRAGDEQRTGAEP